MKDFLKRNWKNIAFILAIAFLIFTNVRQYKNSISIYRENQEVNLKYSALKEKISGQDQIIAQYKDQVKQKDALIDSSKNEIKETEAELAKSQSDVKRLSKKILNNNSNTITPEEFQDYAKNCDSLATVAPILSDQVDTLKSQNQVLVSTMAEKSVIQDSIVKKKDGIILDQTAFLNTTVDSYNKSVIKLNVVENKLAKEKKRRGFWQKAAIGLGLGIIGIISIK